MKKAVVENGVVTNIIVADASFNPPGMTLIDIDSERVAIDDIWDGEKFIPAQPKLQLPTQDERIEALESAMLELVLGGGA